ncbi:uncharacterized protein LACBIDRAFT_331906 [Laccaria bicolor S238N-H82]|uniref:Predicted protein n=1 Tax=Laccaria bicolor (strain S238N-H82 / ATCC MYA-4686) TaxID=486041 RepID=B0DR00_LACBS|nr:uncharacterized protein LACBIDRAFT_331906 [Laccaria bicolor S238N-H82]EDR02977.1 predicted protein [Laccaria bicolor S238N-H82]|eukprot:XP_001886400.1 predicted protein [Laccaria bicolor S238N-H82]
MIAEGDLTIGVHGLLSSHIIVQRWASVLPVFQAGYAPYLSLDQMQKKKKGRPQSPQQDAMEEEDKAITDPYTNDVNDMSSVSPNANPVLDPFAGIVFCLEHYFSALGQCSDWTASAMPESESMPTAFQHIKLIWLVVWPLALKLVGSTHIISNDAGLVFKYSNCYISDYDVELARLKHLIESLITTAGDNLHALLPSGLAFEKLHISCPAFMII